MAASTIGKPGTTFGPCKGACDHRDCAASRADAASLCVTCGKPIGFDSLHFRTASGLEHEVCAWERESK